MAVNWSDVSTWTGILQTANTNSGSWFWTLILYGVWVVILLLFSTWGFEVALLSSAFISLILGLFLTYAELVSWTWITPFIGMILFMFLYIVWSKKT